MKCLLYYTNEDKPFSESHIFNFLLRLLLLFHSCTCASVHTTLCSKSECWCFTHWRPDKPAQLTYLWYARMFSSFDISTTHICLFFTYAVKWIPVIFISYFFPGWLPVMHPLYHTTSSISFASVLIKKLYLKRYSHDSFDPWIPFKYYLSCLIQQNCRRMWFHALLSAVIFLCAYLFGINIKLLPNYSNH